MFPQTSHEPGDTQERLSGHVSSAKSRQTLELPGGRTLGYAEWGDPSGVPLFHFHGSSSSRLEHPLRPEDLEGVRMVTIDRPGHGLSDFQPGRT